MSVEVDQDKHGGMGWIDNIVNQSHCSSIHMIASRRMATI
jgi:hypothetical protein